LDLLLKEKESQFELNKNTMIQEKENEIKEIKAENV